MMGTLCALYSCESCNTPLTSVKRLPVKVYEDCPYKVFVFLKYLWYDCYFTHHREISAFLIGWEKKKAFMSGLRPIINIDQFWIVFYSPEKWLHNRIYCPSNRSKQIQETHMAYSAGTQYTLWKWWRHLVTKSCLHVDSGSKHWM